MPGPRISIVLSAALGGSPQLEAGSTQQFGQKKTPQAGENPAKEAASQLTARKKPCTERDVSESVSFFLAALSSGLVWFGLDPITVPRP